MATLEELVVAGSACSRCADHDVRSLLVTRYVEGGVLFDCTVCGRVEPDHRFGRCPRCAAVNKFGWRVARRNSTSLRFFLGCTRYDECFWSDCIFASLPLESEADGQWLQGMLRHWCDWVASRPYSELVGLSGPATFPFPEPLHRSHFLPFIPCPTCARYSRGGTLVPYFRWAKGGNWRLEYACSYRCGYIEKGRESADRGLSAKV